MNDRTVYFSVYKSVFFANETLRSVRKAFFLGLVHEIIQHLLSLQTRDKEIFDIEQRLQSLPKEYDRINALIQAEKTAIDTERQTLRALELRRKNSELQLQQTEDKILKLKTQQTSIKKVEEYKAMDTAISDAKLSVDNLETEILKAIEEIESLSVKNQLSARSHEKRIEELKLDLTGLQEREKGLIVEATEKKQSAESVKHALQGPFIQAYSTLKQSKLRFPLLVELKNSQCTGCFMKVSRDTAESVKSSKDPVFCESCGRMLFMQD